MSLPRVVVLAGDGIGPEVMASALAVLDAVTELSLEARLFGGASIDADGVPLTGVTLAACQAADAVLVGSVGGPQWDSTTPGAVRPERGLLELRRGLGVYANLRPIRPFPALYGSSILAPGRIDATDMLIVRELTGGLYYGQRGRTSREAFDTCTYGVDEITRIARQAFELARARRGKVSSVDKANVLDTSRLWRDVVTDLHATSYPDLELEHILVDACAMHLIAQPRRFDVILTENLFGDILSDEASVLAGSLGMLPSASLGAGSGPGLFEPAHGTAPEIAGTGTANPIGMILSAALMLRLGLGEHEAADRIEAAVDRALEGGVRTRDLEGSAGTSEVTERVLAEL